MADKIQHMRHLIDVLGARVVELEDAVERLENDVKYLLKGIATLTVDYAFTRFWAREAFDASDIDVWKLPRDVESFRLDE